MSRGGFNEVMDAYFGQASPYGTPGTISYPDIACRLIPQAEITFQTFPLTTITAWITAQGPLVNVAAAANPTAGVCSFDYYVNDVLELPKGSGIFYGILFAQQVLNPPQASYWRYLVTPMPFPF